MKKIIIPALILGVASVASFSAFADTGGVPMSDRAMPKAEIIKALETNTYASLPDYVKAKITEIQFQVAREKYLSKIVKTVKKEVREAKKEMKQEHRKNHPKDEAVQNALETGDYAAFRAAKIAQIPTEAEFQKRVAAHAAHTVALTAIQSAIKSNDFAAFQKAHTDLRATIVALNIEGKEFKTPDDTQMKKHFDKMVEQYKKDGTLPEKGMGQGEMGEMEND